MKSQIDFVDSKTLKPTPAVNPGNITLSSKALPWEGLYIEKGENDAFNPDDVTVAEHYFAMNIGEPYEWAWKEGNRFKTHRYEQGDLWVNPAGVPFSHRINTRNQFILLTLSPAKLIEALPEQPLIKHQVFRRQHKAQDRQLQTLMLSLMAEAEANGPNGKLYADMLATALAVHFVNHYSVNHYSVNHDGVNHDGTGTAINLPTGQTIERQRLGQVIDYIETYLTEDISLADLALISGFSKFHFSRLFKQAFGVTPHRYLMTRRVERAAIALKRPTHQATIGSIAHEFAFADQSHFTRVFKQIKGVTPKQFQRQS